MGEYDKVLDAFEKHDLAWRDIDRILVNEPAYEDFRERVGDDASTYKTDETPAVRLTSGDEKIVYVDEDGYQQEIVL